MSQSSYSFDSFVSAINSNFVVLLIAVIAFVAGVFTGSMVTENKMLKSGIAPAGAAPIAAQPDAGGPTADQLASIPPVTDEDFIRGNKNAKVTLVEYSDFECPYCAAFHPTMLQIMEEYGDKIAWVYRHYPLPFHPQATPAAEASECVAKVGGHEAFWKFADNILEKTAANSAAGKGLAAEDIAAAITASGANKASVDTCVTAGEFKTKVQDIMNKGAAAGISGTPGTIVVSGDQYELINGALPYESVKATIEKYL